MARGAPKGKAARRSLGAYEAHSDGVRHSEGAGPINDLTIRSIGDDQPNPGQIRKLDRPRTSGRGIQSRRATRPAHFGENPWLVTGGSKSPHAAQKRIRAVVFSSDQLVTLKDDRLPQAEAGLVAA